MADAASPTSAWSRSGPSSTGSVITFDPDGLEQRAAELEAKMGEPGFWNDQQGAAQISSEHSRVQRRLERYERLRREYDDAKELLAMDGDMAAEIETSLRPARGRARTPAGRRALLGRVRRGRRGGHDPVRRGRHRRAGLHRDAPPHVPALGAATAASRPKCSRRARGGGRPQVRDLHRRGRERVRDPQGRARQAPPRPPVPVRPGAPPPHLVRPGDPEPAPGRRRRRSRSTRPTSGSTRTARAAPAAST